MVTPCNDGALLSPDEFSGMIARARFDDTCLTLLSHYSSLVSHDVRLNLYSYTETDHG